MADVGRELAPPAERWLISIRDRLPVLLSPLLSYASRTRLRRLVPHAALIVALAYNAALSSRLSSGREDAHSTQGAARH